MCLCSSILNVGNMCNVVCSTDCLSVLLWNDGLSGILDVPNGKRKESKLERGYSPGIIPRR